MMRLGEVPQTTSRRLIVASSASGFVCFSIMITYLYRFPILISSTISDAFIILVLLVWTTTLFISSLAVGHPRGVGLTLVEIWLYAFTVRSVSQLRLGASIQHDPYYYMVSTQNILEGGTLFPTLSGLFPQVSNLLPWPLMQLVTVNGAAITGIQPSLWYAYQGPALGALTSIATFLLARTATKRIDASLVAAMFVASSDLVIYYQAEYHPQGLAVLLLAFFLYAFLKSRAASGVSFGILPLVFAGGLVFVHHFSSLFIALLALGFVLVGFVSERSPLRRIRVASRGDAFGRDYTLWVLVAVAALAYHFLYYPSVAQGFVTLLERSTPSNLLVTAGPRVPLTATVGNAMKWGVLGFALFAVWMSLGSLTRELYRLLVLLALLVAAGVASDFLLGGPADRIVAFYVPVGSVFAGWGVLYLVRRQPARLRRARTQKLAMSGIVIAIMVVGILNAGLPALYLHGSAPNPYYISSNDLSSTGVYQPTGKWIARYANANSTFVAEFDTLMIPFSYGGVPITRIEWTALMKGNLMNNLTANFLVVNPSVPYTYQQLDFSKQAFLTYNNLVYSNGIVEIAGPRDS